MTRNERIRMRLREIESVLSSNVRWVRVQVAPGHERTSARNIIAFVLPASAILTLILLAGVSLMSETQRAEAAARRKRFRSTPGLAAGHAITACVCGSLVVLAAEGHHLLAGCLLFGFCNHAIANSLVDDAASEAER